MNEIFNEVRKSTGGYEVIADPPMPPDAWADSGIDVQVMDGNTVIRTAAGGVAVPGTDGVVRTEVCNYRTSNRETNQKKAISLLPPNGFDCLPKNSA